jgi:trk system potassium uptake protein
MPEYDSGRRLAITLATPTILDQLPLGRGYAVQDVQLPESFAGHTLQEMDLRKMFGLTLAAIERNGEVMVSPSADDVYARGDTLVVIGKIQDLERLGNAE